MTMIDATSRLLRYAMSHPVGQQQPVRTIGRIVAWQLRSRLAKGPHDQPWIGGARLVTERGMAGATGNLYFGLHEFADMAFMLHFLRTDDLLLDIGANVGTYTVLAAKLCGARVMAFEPEPQTGLKLARNIAANAIGDRVELCRYALGAAEGEIGFTAGLDAMNHVTDDPALISQRVPIRRLDDGVGARSPIMIKIDVEGHEDAAFAGAETTLANPSLLAVEAETVSDEAHSRFLSLGFQQYWYDPVSRQLSATEIDNKANNRCYLRNVDEVAKRLRDAPPVNLFGWKV